jgi:hypothetical protein
MKDIPSLHFNVDDGDCYGGYRPSIYRRPIGYELLRNSTDASSRLPNTVAV